MASEVRKSRAGDRRHALERIAAIIELNDMAAVEHQTLCNLAIPLPCPALVNCERLDVRLDQDRVGRHFLGGARQLAAA